MGRTLLRAVVERRTYACACMCLGKLYQCTRLRLGGYTSNTRKDVSSDIQTVRSGLKKGSGAEFFFNQHRSVWISDETLFRVFDIASQSINNFLKNSKFKVCRIL